MWRKQATISVQEEFVGKNLPSNLEDGLPQNLQETFDTVRSGVRRGADLYISLCNLVERLIKREEAMAGEYGRFSMALTSLTETTREAFAIDTNDVPLLNEGIKGTAKHLSATQGLLEDEGRGWEQGLLEDLKTVRDGLVSMRELFDRKDRLARDNIPQLERRIQQNEQKLQGVKAKGDAAKPGEAEKVEIAIVNVSVPPIRTERRERRTDSGFAGQAEHRQPARARGLHQGMRARRAGVLPGDHLPHLAPAPGLGAGAGQVRRVGGGQLPRHGRRRRWDAAGRLA